MCGLGIFVSVFTAGALSHWMKFLQSTIPCHIFSLYFYTIPVCGAQRGGPNAGRIYNEVIVACRSCFFNVLCVVQPLYPFCRVTLPPYCSGCALWRPFGGVARRSL